MAVGETRCAGMSVMLVGDRGRATGYMRGGEVVIRSRLVVATGRRCGGAGVTPSTFAAFAHGNGKSAQAVRVRCGKARQQNCWQR